MADGKPLLLFGKELGISLPTRISGTDLLGKLIEVSNKKGFSTQYEDCQGKRSKIVKVAA